jgi:hypothetical protein
MKKLFLLLATFVALTLSAAEPTAASVADKAVTAVANGSDKAFTGIANGLAPWNTLLVDSMKRLINTTADATNFLIGEVPEFLKEIVMYYMAYHLILFLTGLGMLIALLFVWRRYGGAKEGHWSLSHNNKGEIDIHILPSIVISLGWVYFAIDMITLEWLKWLLAPKLALIQLAIAMVK